MAEYIDIDTAFEAVDKRVNELKGDKQFNLSKEICVRGVMKHLVSIPPANVIEIPVGMTMEEAEMRLSAKECSDCIPGFIVDAAIEDIKKLQTYVFYTGDDKKVDLDAVLEILSRCMPEHRRTNN